MTDLADLIPGNVYTRKDAGLPVTPGGAQRDRDRVIGYTQHWTTGNALGITNTLRWWRNIYEYHTGHNGWADIGYAYGVDRFGNVFTGRGRFRTLAHATGYNTTWLGVAYLGGHDSHVTRDAKVSLRTLWEWLRLDGGMVNMDFRNGHRDIGQTSCPGDLLHLWVHGGMPWPDGGDPDPVPKQPDGSSLPDYIVAVVSSSEADEGAARVLGKAYQWKFLTVGYDAPYSDRIDGLRIGTAVRVGAVRDLSRPEWDETHDIGGRNRDETAAAVHARIALDRGDSRSVV